MTEKTSDIQWHIARDGQQHGPLSEAEIKLFVDGEHLLETDLVWQAEFSDWKPAFDVFPPSAKTGAKQASMAARKEPDADSPAPAETTSPTPIKEDSKPTKAAATEGANKTGPQTNLEQPALKTFASTAPAPVQPTPSAGVTRTPEPITKSVNNTTLRQPQDVSTGQQAGAHSQQTGSQNSQTSAEQATTAGGAMSGAEQNTQNASSYTPDDLYDAEPSGSGRRIAIAAGVLAVLVGGGWFAINNTPTIANFARAAMNATSTATTTDAEPTDTSATSESSAAVKVVKAPDDPAGSAPEASTGSAPEAPTNSTPETSSTNSVPETTTGAQETTAAVDVPPGQQGEQPPPQSSDTIETAAVTPPAPPSATAEPTVDPHYTTSPLWVVVREQFPEWYSERMREIQKLSTEKPKGEVATYAMKWLVTLRRENASSALAASSPKLRGIASAFLSNLQALKAHSTEACFSFISKGETSPTVISLYESGENAKPMEAQATAVFEAIAEGRKTPQKRERPQKPDYDVLATELGQLGWSQADLQMFANPAALARAAPDRVCQMVQDWFSAHIAIKDEAIQERLLFETLRPVIAG